MKIEMTIGVLLIVIYALERFNTPRTTRASTTAFRYYSAAITYLLVYLLTYYTFSKYPHLLHSLGIELALLQELGIAGEPSTPILVALVLALLVPKVPLISELDVRLRGLLHRLASIPYEVIRLSEHIQSRRFATPSSVMEQMQQEAASSGLPAEAQAPELESWNRIAALMIQLRQWRVERPFSTFMQDRAGDFSRLQDRYGAYGSLVANSLSLRRQAQDQPSSDSLQETASRLRKDVQDEARKLMSDLGDFIAQAVLTHCLSASARAAALERLGFEPKERWEPGGISIHKTVALAGLMLLLLMINFIVFSPADGHVERNLKLAAMIVSIYMSVVAWTVYPKLYWPWFRPRQGESFPAAAYVVAGVMAAATAVPINLFFNTLIEVGGVADKGLLEAMQSAWTRFSTRSYPWLTMPLVATVTLSLLVDWRLPHRLSASAGRIIKAFALALVLMVASLLVCLWLEQNGGSAWPFRVLAVSGTVGLVLGYFVPAWFSERGDGRPGTAAGGPVAMVADSP